MSVLYVTHHLYPENPQVFMIDLKHIVTTDSYGELLWHLWINTSALNSSGDRLGPYHYNAYVSEDDLDSFIEGKVLDICNYIDWEKSWYGGEYMEGSDTTPPKISWTFPEKDQEDVPIDSKIRIRAQDLLPSKGMDLSKVKMIINGIEITPDITGNKYDCVISFKPGVDYS